MFNILPTIEKFILMIFSPVTSFLQYSIDRLNSIQLQPVRLINLDYFLGPISLLGDGYIMLIRSLIGCITLLVTIFVAKGIYNIYLNFKDGVKWW